MAESLEKISRREFISNTILAGVRTVFLAACIDGFARKASEEVAHKNAMPESELKDKLQVKEFAEYVVHAAKKSTMFLSYENCLRLMWLGYFAGDSAGSFVSGNSEEMNSRVGAIAGWLGVFSESATSTLMVVPMQDKRFKGYGLDAYLYETNGFVGTHPTPESELTFGTIASIISGAFSFKFPWIGMGFLGMAPGSNIYNIQYLFLVQKSLEIGDKVKSMINNEKNKNEIIDFLRNYK